MKESTLRNSHAVEQLNVALQKRQKFYDELKNDQATMSVVEGDLNFIRNQRLQAFNYASQIRSQGATAADVINDAQAIFNFLVADGVYEAKEKSNLIG